MKDWLFLDSRCKDCLCLQHNGGGCSGEMVGLLVEDCKWYKPKLRHTMIHTCDTCMKSKQHNGSCKNENPGIYFCVDKVPLECSECDQLVINDGHCIGNRNNPIKCPYYKEDKEDKMPGGMSLLDFITKASNQKITKSEFGRIMHDPNATEEEMQEALEALASSDGYENLPDD